MRGTEGNAPQFKTANKSYITEIITKIGNINMYDLKNTTGCVNVLKYLDRGYIILLRTWAYGHRQPVQECFTASDTIRIQEENVDIADNPLHRLFFLNVHDVTYRGTTSTEPAPSGFYAAPGSGRRK